MSYLEEWDKSLSYRQRRGFYRKSLTECIMHMPSTGMKLPKSEYSVIARIIIAESGIKGHERAGNIVELWSSTIPSQYRKMYTNCDKRIRQSPHINEKRFFNLIRSYDAESVLENMRIGVRLIEQYAGTTPSVNSIYSLCKKLESDSKLELSERFLRSWREC